MTNARKICLLLSFFLYILNASAQEEIKKDTTAQNSKGVLVNLTDGIATTVRHTGRKIRKEGKQTNEETTFVHVPVPVHAADHGSGGVGVQLIGSDADILICTK